MHFETPQRLTSVAKNVIKKVKIVKKMLSSSMPGEREDVLSERAITKGISVEAQSFYVPEHSDQKSDSYFFSYRVRIQNSGSKPVQLLSRHWTITDGHGRVEEVKGPGVVGQQPKIPPGEQFEYESFCPLTTPTGSMRGKFQMIFVESGEAFDAEIPQFFLVEPGSFH